MKNLFKIVREVASSQSKGCWLYVQVGCSALVVRQTFGKRRDVAIVHAEIDTPYQRLRVNFHAFGRKATMRLSPNNQSGNSYRDRWLRKLNLA